MLLAVANDPLIKDIKFGIGREVRLHTCRSPHVPTNHLIIFKVFRIFFENLTTTIAQIEIYLNDNPIHRDITFKLRELADFIEYLRGVRTGKVTARKPKRSRSRKKTGEAQAPATSADDVVTTYNNLVQENEAAAYVLSLGSNMDQLDHDLSQIVDVMCTAPLEQHLRLDDRAFMRMLTVCGLQWNENSQAKTRDFSQIALSVIFESLIVPKYREKLLRSCQGASVMRKDLSAYFLTISKSSAPRQGAAVQKQSELRQSGFRRGAAQKDWFFADMIVVDEEAMDTTEYNSKSLLTKLVQMQEKEKKRQADPLVKFADSWKKNPLVACSKKGVAPGTIESSSYYLMEEVFKVGNAIALVPISSPADPSLIGRTSAVDAGEPGPLGTQGRENRHAL